MDTALMLKAVADETRLKILTLLLKHNYCVSSLARSLELSEATISQHLKVLREAGLLSGEKRGYFMHYYVERDVLRGLASDIEALAAIEREGCRHGQNGEETERCHEQGNGEHRHGQCAGEPEETECCQEKQHDGEGKRLRHGQENGGHRHGQCADEPGETECCQEKQHDGEGKRLRHGQENGGHRHGQCGKHGSEAI